MSIFNNARVRDTHHYVVDTIRPVGVSITAEATGVTRPCIDRHAEYVVELTISQNYWANKAQREDAQKTAIQCIAAELYSDVLRELPRLRLCIESGDRRGAHESICRIEQATKP